jgi:eukaryotic-like serine/threonine-protein kinase
VQPNTAREPSQNTPKDPSTASSGTVRLAANGEYEVLGTLGRGGMGVVYRARERKTGRDVALKILLEGGGVNRLARFKREGELTAAFNHPGIVRVHAAGELEGRPFLAYELVEGAIHIGEAFHRWSLHRRVAAVRDVARALGHAHAHGVVHRDVKPENVLVDKNGVVKITDFGLALDEDAERITRTGVLLGTPSYMPPEMFLGRGREQGPAGDVWSLGVMLYKALSGRLPFEGASMGELSAQVTTHDPPPPSTLNVAVPAALDTICLTALEREPGDRYTDGEDLAKDLDAWLEGKRVRASGRSVLRRVPLWALVAVAIASAALALALVLPT